MAKGLMVNKSQIVSNELVEIRSKFGLLPKLIKTAMAFTGNPLGHIIIGDNAVYLCWAGVDEEQAAKLQKWGFSYYEYNDEENTFQDVASDIEKIIKSRLSSSSENLKDKKDHYNGYAEACYLGCRLTTEFHEDEVVYDQDYYYAFAKIVPSWITLEK